MLNKKWKMRENFVAFSEYLNFTYLNIWGHICKCNHYILEVGNKSHVCSLDYIGENLEFVFRESKWWTTHALGYSCINLSASQWVQSFYATTLSRKMSNQWTILLLEMLEYFLFIFEIQKLSFILFLLKKGFELMSSFTSYNKLFYASQKLYGKSFLFHKYRFYYKNNNKQVSLRLDEIEIIKPIFTI